MVGEGGGVIYLQRAAISLAEPCRYSLSLQPLAPPTKETPPPRNIQDIMRDGQYL